VLRSTTAAAALAVVVAGAVLAGCGGGSEPERLSSAALLRRADGICAEGKRESDRLRGQAVIGARGEAAATEIDATLEALEVQIDGFEDLRGPRSTDADLSALVSQLREAADGLEQLREAAVDDDLTVDEAIDANPDVVEQVNRASLRAAESLVALQFVTCVGLTSA